jgi:hypothetical protein
MWKFSLDAICGVNARDSSTDNDHVELGVHYGLGIDGARDENVERPGIKVAPRSPWHKGVCEGAGERLHHEMGMSIHTGSEKEERNSTHRGNYYMSSPRYTKSIGKCTEALVEGPAIVAG